MEQSLINQQVIVALRQITRAIDLHSKQLQKEYGLTVPQLISLKRIQTEEPISVGRLAGQISLSHATVTRILDRLELKGLVERCRDTIDKRKISVRVTDAGKELLDQNPTLMQEVFLRRFSNLEDWEKTLILSSIQRLASMMDVEDNDTHPILSTEPLHEQRHDGK
ncbi:MAG: MarR family transcriptional regulator [Spirochaetales bacterium]|nr:MarR family transcriptional regulator [Spirochaetales bacterium]MCF7937012.1 MarR family transcriptional regulator [Spirochaetales bacterium]